MRPSVWSWQAAVREVGGRVGRELQVAVRAHARSRVALPVEGDREREGDLGGAVTAVVPDVGGPLKHRLPAECLGRVSRHGRRRRWWRRWRRRRPGWRRRWRGRRRRWRWRRRRADRAGRAAQAKDLIWRLVVGILVADRPAVHVWQPLPSTAAGVAPSRPELLWSERKLQYHCWLPERSRAAPALRPRRAPLAARPGS